MSSMSYAERYCETISRQIAALDRFWTKVNDELAEVGADRAGFLEVHSMFEAGYAPRTAAAVILNDREVLARP